VAFRSHGPQDASHVDDPRRILVPMRVPDWMGSVRFRMTVIYSTVLFGLAALVVGLVYLGLARSLEDQPVHQQVTVREITPVPDGAVVTSRQLEGEMRSLEELVNQRALEQLRAYSFAALILLFVASLGVGWVVSGQASGPHPSHQRRGPPDPGHRPVASHRPGWASRRAAGAGRHLRRHAGPHRPRLRAAAAVHPRGLPRAAQPVGGHHHQPGRGLSDPDAGVDDLRETGRSSRPPPTEWPGWSTTCCCYARREAPTSRAELVELADVVALSAAEFRAPAEARQIRLQCAATPGLWVHADPVALRQALANLLANAVRLAPTGSLVRVAAGRHQGWVWAAVEDEGPGIPEGEQAAVFQRFWRGDEAAARAEGRSGLGLAIVRQIAEAYGGEVRLASEAGRGSTFSLWLPEAEGADADAGARAAGARPAGADEPADGLGGSGHRAPRGPEASGAPAGSGPVGGADPGVAS
jgi:anti-sigma regulatory factor (Ser/Thr protein kinase)